MPLTIINDTPNAGVYLGGWNIAPDGVLIAADSFDSAWELLCEHYAEQGSLPACEADHCEGFATDEIPCDGCDFIDMHGAACTLDVVLRVVRPGRRD